MGHTLRFWAFLAILLTAVCASPVYAGELEDAKAAGFLGEQPNGYLGVVKNSAPANIVKLAEEINLKRRAKYREIAAKNQTNLSAVEAVVGQKLIQRANPGEYILTPSGQWRQK